MTWWLRRIARPWETARVLAPRWLPLAWRRRLMTLMGRDRDPERPARDQVVGDWQQERDSVFLSKTIDLEAI